MLFLYLDESGDLGFDFVNKKPSKFFVVTILVVNGQDNNRKLIKGVKKTLRRKLNPKNKRNRIVQELKGTGTTFEIKRYCYHQLKDIDFKIYSIILNKRRVHEALIKNKARIYNYISRLLLEKIPFDDESVSFQFIIDKSKNRPEILDFNNYIRSQLEARINPGVPLDINHLVSCDNCGLQAVDMFSYGFFETYERKKKDWLNVFQDKIGYYTVYLP
jgi:hypothetical protein